MNVTNRQPALRFDDIQKGAAIRGGQSEEIKLLQRQLGVKDDGIFGQQTRQALSQWQSKHGLAADGVFGVNTRNAMFAKSGDGWEAKAPQARPNPAPEAKPAPAKTEDAKAPQHVGGVTVTPAMQRFAQIARRNAEAMNTTGRCALGVNTAIDKAFGFRPYGHANTRDTVLPATGKFKKVNMSLEQALKVPGLVLVWERTSTNAGKIYGHTAVTLGDGRSSASDFVERNTLTKGGRSGLTVLMPV